MKALFLVNPTNPTAQSLSKKTVKTIGVVFLFIGIFSFILAQEESFVFSHKMHIEDIGVDCISCHPSVVESKTAKDKNMPTHDECFVCHDDDTASQKCATCHADPDNPHPIPAVKRDYFFDHSFHIETQKMECIDCHRGLENTDLANEKNMPVMEQCFQCHNDLTASKQCRTCHTADAVLIPNTHNSDWAVSHGHAAAFNEDKCADCHRDNYCEDCHSGTRLLEIGDSDKDYIGPNTPSTEDGQNMVLVKVHDLNYRYSHGIDANSKKTDCTLCHQETQFCVRCHQEDEKITYLKPSWHSGPDWGAIVEAVGSGGGKHAELARRDIERCASCHDSQGEDPVCLMCHRDFVPGRGNDLKTHSPGMFSGMGGGSWHVDEGSICYNCHTDSKTAGIGFCGYCHSMK